MSVESLPKPEEIPAIYERIRAKPDTELNLQIKGADVHCCIMTAIWINQDGLEAVQGLHPKNADGDYRNFHRARCERLGVSNVFDTGAMHGWDQDRNASPFDDEDDEECGSGFKYGGECLLACESAGIL